MNTSINTTILQAEQLIKQVKLDKGSLTILDGIDLSLKVGVSTAILGISGSGKTTLLGILAGLDLPSSGSLTLFGEDLLALSEDQRAKLRLGKVGFVFQEFILLENLTALENVSLGLELLGKKSVKAEAAAMLELVGLADRQNHFPKQLSGGEQQRVALARAFVIQPKLLFLDEPTANLDEATGAKIAKLIFELQQKFATTVVCVTHDKILADNCDTILHLHAGKLHKQG